MADPALLRVMVLGPVMGALGGLRFIKGSRIKPMPPRPVKRNRRRHDVAQPARFAVSFGRRAPVAVKDTAEFVWVLTRRSEQYDQPMTLRSHNIYLFISNLFQIYVY